MKATKKLLRNNKIARQMAEVQLPETAPEPLRALEAWIVKRITIKNKELEPLTEVKDKIRVGSHLTIYHSVLDKIRYEAKKTK